MIDVALLTTFGVMAVIGALIMALWSHLKRMVREKETSARRRDRCTILMDDASFRRLRGDLTDRQLVDLARNEGLEDGVRALARGELETRRRDCMSNRSPTRLQRVINIARRTPLRAPPSWFLSKIASVHLVELGMLQRAKSDRGEGSLYKLTDDQVRPLNARTDLESVTRAAIKCELFKRRHRNALKYDTEPLVLTTGFDFEMFDCIKDSMTDREVFKISMNVDDPFLAALAESELSVRAYLSNLDEAHEPKEQASKPNAASSTLKVYVWLALVITLIVAGTLQWRGTELPPCAAEPSKHLSKPLELMRERVAESLHAEMSSPAPFVTGEPVLGTKQELLPLVPAPTSHDVSLQPKCKQRRRFPRKKQELQGVVLEENKTLTIEHNECGPPKISEGSSKSTSLLVDVIMEPLASWKVKDGTGERRPPRKPPYHQCQLIKNMKERWTDVKALWQTKDGSSLSDSKGSHQTLEGGPSRIRSIL